MEERGAILLFFAGHHTRILYQLPNNIFVLIVPPALSIHWLQGLFKVHKLTMAA
jgi:hypothetical protein